MLIGVELDKVVQFGLLARHVGSQAVNEGAPESVHGQISTPGVEKVETGY